MVRKNVKNALYAEILEIVDKLNKDNNMTTEELSSIKRISNTIIPLLIKSGVTFYTNEDEWKNSKNLYIKINENEYQIPLNQVRSVLEQDYKKILDKRFSKNKENNIIDFTIADSFDFSEYINHPYIIKQNTNTEKIKSDKNINDKKEKPNVLINKTNDEKDKNISIKKNVKEKPQENINPKINKKIEEEKKQPAVQDLNLELENLLLNEDEIENKPLIESKTKKAKSIKQETNLLKKEEKHNDLPLESNEFDLLIDEDDIPMEEFGNKEKQNENVEISVETLIMDIYNVKFKNEENTEKNYTIIVAPAKEPEAENTNFAPTFSMAKIGKNIITNASPNLSRSSYQIIIDGEVFVIRGKWDKDGFYSYLYPQNINNYQISIQKRQMKPAVFKNIGHNIIRMENGINIHILPLSSKNVKDNKTGLLICLEDIIEEKFITAFTSDDLTANITYNNKNYNISAGWFDRILKSTINIK